MRTLFFQNWWTFFQIRGHFLILANIFKIREHFSNSMNFVSKPVNFSQIPFLIVKHFSIHEVFNKIEEFFSNSNFFPYFVNFYQIHDFLNRWTFWKSLYFLKLAKKNRWILFKLVNFFFKIHDFFLNSCFLIHEIFWIRELSWWAIVGCFSRASDRFPFWTSERHVFLTNERPSYSLAAIACVGWR